MEYLYSNLDDKNAKNFINNLENLTLKEILLTGNLRGLKNCSIVFDYPISAISGKNGTGKSTILALAACAYHNANDGFKPPLKKNSYYTFSDFFIQTASEIKQDGIIINYIFLSKWEGVIPDGPGMFTMQKKKNGKWSRYENRPIKNVVYLGIERLVPQHERQVYKTYRKKFHDQAELKEWYDDVALSVGQILGKKYDKYIIQTAGNYTLPIVSEKGKVYSGFNMGAGEKALFELFSFIHQCSIEKKPSLILIDEIELGLHDEAQKKLIGVLKDICIPKRIQIICTTHSPTILDALPPEGRYYIENAGRATVITQKITSKYAAGRLAEENSSELDIFVEDETAAIILETILTHEQRTRANLFPIGSYNAICRQLAARHRVKSLKCIAIFDGDQTSIVTKLEKAFCDDLELSTKEAKEAPKKWFESVISFLPGPGWPEKWLLETLKTCLNDVNVKVFGVSHDKMNTFLDKAILAGKHNEFFELGNLLAVGDRNTLKKDVTRLISANKPNSFLAIQKIVSDNLV